MPILFFLIPPFSCLHGIVILTSSVLESKKISVTSKKKKDSDSCLDVYIN